MFHSPNGVTSKNTTPMKMWQNNEIKQTLFFILGFIAVYLYKKRKISMVPNIGFVHMSCLTVLCSVFFIIFANNQGKYTFLLNCVGLTLAQIQLELRKVRIAEAQLSDSGEQAKSEWKEMYLLPKQFINVWVNEAFQFWSRVGSYVGVRWKMRRDERSMFS